MASVDPKKVGIWGLSYGGLNVLQAIARDSDMFAAGVSIAGIFNWISASRCRVRVRVGVGVEVGVTFTVKIRVAGVTLCMQ